MPVNVYAKLRGLYAITDTHLIPRERFVETVEAAVRGGATMIQLREKDTPRAEMVQLGRAVLDVTRRYGALLIINDHPSVAKEIGADGAHVGREDPPVAEARALLGPQAIIGASCYGDVARAMAAEKEPIPVAEGHRKQQGGRPGRDPVHSGRAQFQMANPIEDGHGP